MPKLRINYLAVVVAAVAHFAFGAAWYSLLAEPWVAGIGKTMAEMEQGTSALPYILSFVGLLVAAFGLAWLIGRLGAQTLAGGAKLGGLLALVFIAAYMAVNYGFQNRPLTLWLIDAGYAVIGMAIMGAILGVWKRKV